ncbi:MAG: alpha/beta fold hydrolase [Pseudomonadota bacterium]
MTAPRHVPEFASPWWLPDGHTQTLWRRFVSHAPLPRRRQRIELADGDFIDLDWLEAAPSPDLPSVFLLHGLCGSSASPYILSLQRLLHSHGYTSVAMNFRGCSGEINRLARAYHSGCIEDVEEVYQTLQRQTGGRSLAFVGFSLGGNVLLKWLSEIGRRAEVVSGVAVSAPFALAQCSSAMNSGLSKAYGHYFRRRLVADMERKRDHFRVSGLPDEFEKLAALGDLQRLQTLWEFDDQVTAPLHGFEGARHYYETCSSGPLLPVIQTPVQLIQSANDPIIPASSLPDAGALPAHVRLHLTGSGGHVGFTCAGQPLWLEQRILAALEWPRNA